MKSNLPYTVGSDNSEHEEKQIWRMQGSSGEEIPGRIGGYSVYVRYMFSITSVYVPRLTDASRAGV
jgi:hypothetical protein